MGKHPHTHVQPEQPTRALAHWRATLVPSVLRPRRHAHACRGVAASMCMWWSCRDVRAQRVPHASPREGTESWRTGFGARTLPGAGQQRMCSPWAPASRARALAADVRPSSAAHQYPNAALPSAGSHAGAPGAGPGRAGRSPPDAAPRCCSSALRSRGPGRAACMDQEWPRADW